MFKSFTSSLRNPFKRKTSRGGKRKTINRKNMMKNTKKNKSKMFVRKRKTNNRKSMHKKTNKK